MREPGSVQDAIVEVKPRLQIAPNPVRDNRHAVVVDIERVVVRGGCELVDVDARRDGRERVP